jgi:glycosyltransferase involved in cell wall biosynthesis
MSSNLPAASVQPHIMLFEPGMEGHHVSWLRYVAEDLLAAGFRLTLAVDMRPEAVKLIHDNLSSIINNVSLISVFSEAGKFHGGSTITAMAYCLEKSGAREVFVNNLDHIASLCLRKAAVGILPPALLLGRISGVYLRPRFLASAKWPPGNIIKDAGFARLCADRWFKNIFFLDEYLCVVAKEKYAGPAFHVLPDPWDGDFSLSQKEARNALGIPTDRFVLLNYGVGDRRKGLHLTVQAMLDRPLDSRLFLLCAGKVSPARGLSDKLLTLEKQGAAKILNRYVSVAEESLCFCASDTVLLTYRKHFGSSGVLSLAAAAGKMVIASDEGLVAQRVRDHNLGWLFSSGRVAELKKCMAGAASLSESDRDSFRLAALAYAARCSRAAFRSALLAPLSDIAGG